ncbi:hypothetical protein [Actinosynnema sp. NPDC020468]|uniref:hypothetical protein n=1 Tax=Actinosynnema sp. NPDC020468 TaxID=3154488 RepID=UPI0033F2537E
MPRRSRPAGRSASPESRWALTAAFLLLLVGAFLLGAHLGNDTAPGASDQGTHAPLPEAPDDETPEFEVPEVEVPEVEVPDAETPDVEVAEPEVREDVTARPVVDDGADETPAPTDEDDATEPVPAVRLEPPVVVELVTRPVEPRPEPAPEADDAPAEVHLATAPDPSPANALTSTYGVPDDLSAPEPEPPARTTTRTTTGTTVRTPVEPSSPGQETGPHIRIHS